MTRPVLLLVNPAASGGRAREVAAEARAELELAGTEHETVETRDLSHAREEAAAAGAAGALVLACGGDGFIGTVGGALAGTEGTLAVIPGGRGNDFARVLEIPTGAREAVRLALGGQEKMIDVAACDGQPFVCIASCGFDSDANRIANETRVVRGSMVYLYAALKALWEWKPARFEVTVDGEPHPVTGYSVVVGNSRSYGGGMFILPEAEMDDGQLDVMLSADVSKPRFLRSLPKVFKGTHGSEPSISFLRGRRVEVAADRPFAVYADGDPIGKLPCVLTLDPGSLRVVVPSGT